jgi:hypothetical protein
MSSLDDLDNYNCTLKLHKNRLLPEPVRLIMPLHYCLFRRV